MRKSVPIMKALITVLFGIGVCSCSTTRISEVGESTPKLDSMVYYIFQEEYDECSTSILELSYKDGKVNSSLKFEIKAKQFYAASQRVL